MSGNKLTKERIEAMKSIIRKYEEEEGKEESEEIGGITMTPGEKNEEIEAEGYSLEDEDESLMEKMLKAINKLNERLDSVGGEMDEMKNKMDEMSAKPDGYKIKFPKEDVDGGQIGVPSKPVGDKGVNFTQKSVIPNRPPAGNEGKKEEYSTGLDIVKAIRSGEKSYSEMASILKKESRRNPYEIPDEIMN